MTKTTLLSALGLLALTLSAPGASLITNGSLDAWDPVTGTPPAGRPLGWYVLPSVTQTAGLTSGSVYSATLPGTGPLVQTTSAQASNFTMSYNFVATAANGGNAGMRLDLLNASEQIVMAFAFFNDPTGLRLTAYSSASTSWVTIATGIVPSVYDSANGVYTTSNVYSFGLTADWANATYSLTIGPAGGSQTTYSNLNYYYSTPNSAALNKIYFRNVSGGASLGTFAVDNVTLDSVPEPGTVALLGLGMTGVLLGVYRRRVARV